LRPGKLMGSRCLPNELAAASPTRDHKQEPPAADPLCCVAVVNCGLYRHRAASQRERRRGAEHCRG
jgi:hypothetical protein